MHYFHLDMVIYFALYYYMYFNMSLAVRDLFTCNKATQKLYHNCGNRFVTLKTSGTKTRKFNIR